VVAQLTAFVRAAFAAGRPDLAWWLIGSILEAAGKIRQSIRTPQPNWDADYQQVVASYEAEKDTDDAPSAVLITAQAATLLSIVANTLPQKGKQYIAALMDTWTQQIQIAAPGLSVAPLRRAKPQPFNWLGAAAIAGGATLALKWIFGGAKQEQECVTVVQLPEGWDEA